MRALLFFAIFAISFTACKPKTQQGNTAEAAAPAPAWPTLPIEILRTLVAECDYIDLIMYNPQFSMSVNERNNVVSAIQQISETAPAANPANQPSGHIFYQSKGETLLEADLYLGPGGNYFVFYQDNKPAFANAMTEQGAAFYAQVLNQLRQGAPQ